MPVEIAVLGAFVVAVTALVMSPGPDTMLILRYTLASGPRVGLATVAGVQVGLALHTLLAVLGVSLIIASSPLLFKTVAIAGAAYLGWLGVQGLRGGGALSLHGGGSVVGTGKACRDAILCNVLNPKVIILFLALFPNFVDTGRDDVPVQLITLAAVLIAINVLWQAPMVWAAEAVRCWLISPAVARAMARGAGAVLLAFALLMLYEHLF
jgi:threonine/homoserine/homoserine lactone efflux protein